MLYFDLLFDEECWNGIKKKSRRVNYYLTKSEFLDLRLIIKKKPEA